MKSNFTLKLSIALSFLFALCFTVSLSAQSITITAPASVAGDYDVQMAGFGPATLVSGDIVYAADTSAALPNEGCFMIDEDLTGKIAMIDRGSCAFTDKVINAQNAGAIALLLCNSATGSANPETGTRTMTGLDPGFTIPSIMVSYDNCNILKVELGNGLAGSLNFPAGEVCQTAITANTGVNTVDTLTGISAWDFFWGALDSPDDGTASKWYSFTSPAMAGLLTIASCDGGADTRLSVFSGGGCSHSDTQAFWGNDDACDLGDGNAWASSVDILDGTGGVEYKIMWDDRWSASGFDFEITYGALPIVDVTVSVDMSAEAMDNGAHIAGEFNGWSSVPMTDNMDGTYTFTITGVTAGDTIEYLFQNGENMNWEGFPAFEDICTVTTPDGMFTNRILVGGIENSSVPVVCFNSCELCPPPACSDPDAIICDDFEMYTLDLVSAQAAHWTPWSLTPGAGDDAIVSNAFSTSGTQSLLVSEANGDDMLLQLGDQTTGRYLLSWKMYVPTGATGYFNTQKIEGSPGGEFGAQVEFFADGTMTLDAGAADVVTVSWTADTWMDLALVVDLTNDWMTYTLNGEEVYSWPASWQTFGMAGMNQLGAINFFGNADTEQYIDDVLFKALPECGEDAVICDSYETYATGSTTGGQAPWWTTWSGTHGGAEDGIVSDAQAFDGSNSMYIAPGQAQDVLLLLGNQTSGNWQIEWQMYVPTGSYGYHNIQEDETPGVQWNMEAWFNATNASVYTPGMGQLASGETYTTPQDAWFPVVSMIDLDNGTHTFMVDGNVVLDNVPYAGTQIGGIDFFSIGDDNNAYFDAIRFRSLDPIVVQNPVDVTFNVNMNDGILVTDPAGVFIAGEMNAWTGELMTDNGDGTWSATYELLEGDTVEYKFQNGVDGWENAIPEDCTLGGFGNRFVDVGNMDMNIGVVCFDQCVDCVVGTEDLEFANAISIFPNPAAEVTNVEYSFEASTDLMIRMTNNLGQLISQDMVINAQQGTHQLGLNNLASGLYYIHITDGNRNMVEKLIVE